MHSRVNKIVISNIYYNYIHLGTNARIRELCTFLPLHQLFFYRLYREKSFPDSVFIILVKIVVHFGRTKSAMQNWCLLFLLLLPLKVWYLFTEFDQHTAESIPVGQLKRVHLPGSPCPWHRLPQLSKNNCSQVYV